MSLGAGVRLGPYEVVSAIDAGGMGEVYRAHDTKLNRDVALKILPAAFASDLDLIAKRVDDRVRNGLTADAPQEQSTGHKGHAREAGAARHFHQARNVRHPAARRVVGARQRRTRPAERVRQHVIEAADRVGDDAKPARLEDPAHTRKTADRIRQVHEQRADERHIEVVSNDLGCKLIRVAPDWFNTGSQQRVADEEVEAPNRVRRDIVRRKCRHGLGPSGRQVDRHNVRGAAALELKAEKAGRSAHVDYAFAAQVGQAIR
jgi:hypothetical protein